MKFTGATQLKDWLKNKSKLSKSLSEQGIPACDNSRLYSYLNFYRAYPQISEAISSETLPIGLEQGELSIFRSLTGKSNSDSNDDIAAISGNLLLTRLSYAHL
jgi:hypothetical protein